MGNGLIGEPGGIPRRAFLRRTGAVAVAAPLASAFALEGVAGAQSGVGFAASTGADLSNNVFTDLLQMFEIAMKALGNRELPAKAALMVSDRTYDIIKHGTDGLCHRVDQLFRAIVSAERAASSPDGRADVAAMLAVYNKLKSDLAAEGACTS